MTPVEHRLLEAVTERDAKAVRTNLVERTFVVIKISNAEALVAFTSEARAGVFVEEMDDLFDEDDEVEGLFIEGDALIDQLGDGLGLLINPEDESAAVIDPELAKQIAS